jgi:hypothetical protein
VECFDIRNLYRYRKQEKRDDAVIVTVRARFIGTMSLETYFTEAINLEAFGFYERREDREQRE